MEEKVSEKSAIKTVLNYSSVHVDEVCHNVLDCIQQSLVQGFRSEDIDSYTHYLTVLTDLLRCYSSDAACDKKEENLSFKDIRAHILQDVCLPLLGNIFPSVDKNPEVNVLLGIVGRLIAECIKNEDEMLCSILQIFENDLEKFKEAKPTDFDLQHDKSFIDIYSLLEVSRHVITSIRSTSAVNERIAIQLRSIFDKLIDAIEYISVDLTGSVCIPVLLRIMKVDSCNLPKYLVIIWKYIKNFSNLSDKRTQYIMLCGFANYFFPVTEGLKGIDVKEIPEFWEILQNGLIDKDSVNRKRSLYLLKRIVDICESTMAVVNNDAKQNVFWWSKSRSSELSKTWQDFMLLAEVLEEKQVNL